MTLFMCKVCKEEVPASHPAFEPPPELELQLTKPGSSGCAACDVGVESWQEKWDCAMDQDVGIESWQEKWDRAIDQDVGVESWQVKYDRAIDQDVGIELWLVK